VWCGEEEGLFKAEETWLPASHLNLVCNADVCFLFGVGVSVSLEYGIHVMGFALAPRCWFLALRAGGEGSKLKVGDGKSIVIRIETVPQ
jgi:hypothetical protein